MHIKIKVEFLDNFDEVRDKAKNIADILNIDVVFKFNDSIFTVEPTIKEKTNGKK